MTTGEPGGESDATTARTPSLVEVRSLVRRIIARERAGAARHVVVLAVDGVPHALARRHWVSARTRRMRSVLPTTSSAAWLSSLTGRAVAAHGVPGVVFALPEAGPGLVNVLTYRGPDLVTAGDNLFSDAAASGYRPVAIGSDLDGYDCAWRDALLRGATTMPGHRFYPTGDDGGYRPRSPAAVRADVERAVGDALAAYGHDSPCLVWCFVEVDRHVHWRGYDGHVRAVLAALDDMARALASAGAVVVAYADHGLVPTVHDPGFAAAVATLQQRFGFAMGGAGRIRWLYPVAGTQQALAEALSRTVADRARVVPTARVLHLDGLLRDRVGPLALVARGESFLSEPGYRYDHGTAAPDELYVPFSIWGPDGAQEKD